METPNSTCPFRQDNPANDRTFLPASGFPLITSHSSLATGLWFEQRKKNDILEGRLVQQQHRQPVHADAQTRRRRHAVFERLQKTLVNHPLGPGTWDLGPGTGFPWPLAPGPWSLDLGFEALALLHRIVQLGVGV